MITRRSFIGSLSAGVGGVILTRNAIADTLHAVNGAKGTSAKMLALDEDFWMQIQSAFALDRTFVNLNNGGVSPSPRIVMDAMKQYLDLSNQGPSYAMWRILEPRVETVRTQLAGMFGRDTEEIAITRNASESLENIQLGLPMTAGDEVIITTQDYPRMLTTWDQRARREKIVVKRVTYPMPLKNPKDYLNAVEAAITPRTKLIHVSQIVFMTGQIMPVREVARMAHARGIKVLCDGAHAFAHYPFTWSDLECDYYGTSLHKWLYGPIGTGMLFVKKELIPEIWPLMAAPPELDANIRKFEEIGTHPAANHNALAEAVTFNQALGLDRKAARLRYLNHRWVDRLRKYSNVKFVTTIDDPNAWCGIVLVDIEGIDPVKLSGYLFDKHRIFTTTIAHTEFKGLRVSPNVYVTLPEIDRFGDVMEKIAKGELTVG